MPIRRERVTVGNVGCATMKCPLSFPGVRVLDGFERDGPRGGKRARNDMPGLPPAAVTAREQRRLQARRTIAEIEPDAASEFRGAPLESVQSRSGP